MHLNQVHKETLSQVENALPNRQGLEVEIFGMEGIPQEALDQHRNRIIQNFYQAQEDRRIATGNPASGQAMPRKKIKMEASEDLLKRLAEFRAQKKAGVGNPGAEAAAAAADAPAPAAPTLPVRSRRPSIVPTQLQNPVLANSIRRRAISNKLRCSRLTPVNRRTASQLPSLYQPGRPAPASARPPFRKDPRKEPGTGPSRPLQQPDKATILIS